MGMEQPAAGAIPRREAVGQRCRVSLVDPVLRGGGLSVSASSGQPVDVGLTGGDRRRARPTDADAQIRRRHPKHVMVRPRQQQQHLGTEEDDRISGLWFDNGGGVVGRVSHRPPSPRLSWAIEPVQ